MEVPRGAVRLRDASRRFRIDDEQVISALDAVTVDARCDRVVRLLARNVLAGEYGGISMAGE